MAESGVVVINERRSDCHWNARGAALDVEEVSPGVASQTAGIEVKAGNEAESNWDIQLSNPNEAV